MAFFDDCDKILKIHYEHFYNGPFDENNEQIWPKLEHFYRICEKTLAIKDYGYTQAIHHQLVNDGHLVPIGNLHDLTQKVHRMTPKGFAFVIGGGYKEQIKNEQEKLKLNKMSATGAQMGWIIAAILGIFQMYQGYQNNNESTELKKEISQIQSRLASDSLENQKRLSQPQTLEKNIDSVVFPTKTKKDSK
ncbi:hypothetical protein [Flectobacillus major]|uniref:hypothetical protein n=1 Tax=Flectobacillus major TaxID=103 RepID=UPI000419ADA0|nr:hypothetical protein [Flectobacillus major]